MARLPDFAQGIVALDVGPWVGRQRQSLGRLYRRRVRWSPIDQAVQQVQDMGLRRGAGLQRQFDGGEHGLFVMLEDQRQNLDHLAVAARRLEHALLQSPEGRRQFDERRSRWTRHVGDTRLAYSTKPSNGRESCIRRPTCSAHTSTIAPGCEPCSVLAHTSRQRVSSQSFSAARVRKSGMGCQSRWRASWTFFSICPFSHPEAGLQNSASNRKWLTIAEKRALPWRSLPRPVLSTAVRILS